MISDFITGKTALLCFMGICAICDHRSRSVSVSVFAAAFFLELAAYTVLALSGYPITWLNVLTGLVPGCLTAAVSCITRGGLGLGDAVYFGITGLAIGGFYNMILFAGGIMLSAVYGLGLTAYRLIRGQSACKASFALLPFVLPVGAAMMVMI